MLPIYSLGFCLLVAFSCRAYELSYAVDDLKPEQILKQLLPEVPEIRIVLPKDLEPNPPGIYHRYAFIRGDFNSDGIEDIAISGTDEWVRQGASRSRNGYVLIASKTEQGGWVRVFFHKFPKTANPFLIWDKQKMALLVGANYSDYNPGDILWDPKAKKYRLVETTDR